MRELKAWERGIFYACFGVSLEIVFTSVLDFTFMLDPRLVGQSYLWMFPIWGLGLLALEKVSTQDAWKQIPWYYRGLAHALLIFCIEALSGATIREVTGSVPWDYSEAFFGIDGLVRLDYLPFWAGLGLALERLFPYIDRIKVAE